MTTEQVLKLDNIKTPADLTWEFYSYEAGHPKCICSGCGKPVVDIGDYVDEHHLTADQMEELTANNFPIRITKGKGKKMREAILHSECFQWLNSHREGFQERA